MADFSDMRVGRDGIAIRQDEARESVGMLFEDGTKIGEFHAASIFLLRNVVKPRAAPALAPRLLAWIYFLISPQVGIFLPM